MHGAHIRAPPLVYSEVLQGNAPGTMPSAFGAGLSSQAGCHGSSQANLLMEQASHHATITNTLFCLTNVCALRHIEFTCRHISLVNSVFINQIAQVDLGAGNITVC